MLVPCLLLVAACGIPRDPEGTLARVRGGTLRVGVSDAPPWVMRQGDAAAGAEPELVRRFAASLGAEPQWTWGNLEQHFTALEHRQLDLVVGGIEAATPWKKRIGLTRPYYVERMLVGAAPGLSPPVEIDGREVAVGAGTPLGHLVEKADGRPLPHPRPAAHRGLVAAPAWQLSAWGFTVAPRAEPLHRVEHVMGVPPGENAWLVALESFLDGQRAEVEPLLRRAQAR